MPAGASHGNEEASEWRCSQSPLCTVKNNMVFMMFGFIEIHASNPLLAFTRLAETPEVMNAAPATGAGSPSERGGAVRPQRGSLEMDGHGNCIAALYRG